MRLLFLSLLFLTQFAFAADDDSSESNTTATTYSTDTQKAGSRWGLSYFNFSNADKSSVDDGYGSWSIYQYLSINYKISKDERFHIRPAMTVITPGFDKFNNSKSFQTIDNDFHIAYTNYTMLSPESDYNLVGRFYMYFPTTEGAKNKKWVTRLKSWMTLEKAVTKDFVVSYNFKPDYFMHTQKAYKTEKSFGAVADNNQIGSLDHYIELGYRLNKWFTPQLDIGMVHDWYHTSAEADSMPALVEKYKIAPTTWFNLANSLKFILGVEYKYDAKAANFSNPDEVNYYIMTFATFL